jgi:peptidoglycan/LPS O-acetylase OafA/YrhL
MSLEKSNIFSEFIYKRWIRLFPAMLIATIIIYYTAVFLPEKPEGITHYHNVISGLIFINPVVIEKITGINIGILEGTFWTLFVEVKF